MDVELIKTMFDNYGIKYIQNSLSAEENVIPEYLKSWAEMMGMPIKFDVSDYGVANVYLLSKDEIVEELIDLDNKIIHENNCYVIAHGPNGDLICVDTNDDRLVFVFHDELWEAEEVDFMEISIKTDLELKDLLERILSGAKYPADGFDAEEYMSNR